MPIQERDWARDEGEKGVVEEEKEVRLRETYYGYVVERVRRPKDRNDGSWFPAIAILLLMLFIHWH